MIIRSIIAILITIVKIGLPIFIIYEIIATISYKTTSKALEEYEKQKAKEELDDIEKELNRNNNQP